MSDSLIHIAEHLSKQIQQAAASQSGLCIQGSHSKAFYGRANDTEQAILSSSDYRGIINYEPTELVITAAAGTPLSEVEQTLAEHNQCLPFQPPHFGPEATLGGTIACGFSGPSRPYLGSARDYVLGTKMINGRGEVLNFGGQVMKNVAGYDVSRLLTGSLGNLGLLLEISLKVLPLPHQTLTLTQQCSEAKAIECFNRWANKPYPISAAAFYQDTLYLRLSGAASAVKAAFANLEGDELNPAESDNFWHDLREHQLPFFQSDTPLWRLSIPPATGCLNLPGQTLLDWGGAQRWLMTALDADAVFAAAKGLAGHATLFRGGDRSGAVFQALPTALMQLHQRLKHSFDPHNVFNPGRMYPEL